MDIRLLRHEDRAFERVRQGRFEERLKVGRQIRRQNGRHAADKGKTRRAAPMQRRHQLTDPSCGVSHHRQGRGVAFGSGGKHPGRVGRECM